MVSFPRGPAGVTSEIAAYPNVLCVDEPSSAQPVARTQDESSQTGLVVRLFRSSSPPPCARVTRPPCPMYTIFLPQKQVPPPVLPRRKREGVAGLQPMAAARFYFILFCFVLFSLASLGMTDRPRQPKDSPQKGAWPWAHLPPSATLTAIASTAILRQCPGSWAMMISKAQPGLPNFHSRLLCRRTLWPGGRHTATTPPPWLGLSTFARIFMHVDIDLQGRSQTSRLADVGLSSPWSPTSSEIERPAEPSRYDGKDDGGWHGRD